METVNVSVTVLTVLHVPQILTLNPKLLEQSYEELCHFVETVHKGGCNTCCG